ncbi:hypothetical protein HNR72_007993 [Streptomyces collinus]|uniref:Uncharacterized protein n=1 Tax=Streptomyces collinus TaxID=42684 RepID=A0AA89QQ08_STRCU|nr:hypothetical protein [Streptomyces collinus]MBB5816871.1 hypothetical protein [Streptomyces collinus]
MRGKVKLSELTLSGDQLADQCLQAGLGIPAGMGGAPVPSRDVVHCGGVRHGRGTGRFRPGGGCGSQSRPCCYWVCAGARSAARAASWSGARCRLWTSAVFSGRETGTEMVRSPQPGLDEGLVDTEVAGGDLRQQVRSVLAQFAQAGRRVVAAGRESCLLDTVVAAASPAGRAAQALGQVLVDQVEQAGVVADQTADEVFAGAESFERRGGVKARTPENFWTKVPCPAGARPASWTLPRTSHGPMLAVAGGHQISLWNGTSAWATLEASARSTRLQPSPHQADAPCSPQAAAPAYCSRVWPSGAVSRKGLQETGCDAFSASRAETENSVAGSAYPRRSWGHARSTRSGRHRRCRFRGRPA